MLSIPVQYIHCQSLERSDGPLVAKILFGAGRVKDEVNCAHSHGSRLEICHHTGHIGEERSVAALEGEVRFDDVGENYHRMRGDARKADGGFNESLQGGVNVVEHARFVRIGHTIRAAADIFGFLYHRVQKLGFVEQMCNGDVLSVNEVLDNVV